ncbi:PEP-CTERM sorting domain-containing protein [Roseibacillus persicicus]|uniref:PEP-CTERM sorting domain-containing protein n=1 Tax=Roseibacillus persicicus TaxID=454148 RepID=UPI00281070F0|nr:PEP-CTERM sorting domain-containing protein [Roseibacillus persicicus]MDQ8191382.1 PEP-CTERM sorting domain-containing protein [Roseibacillus persicicus]
MKPKQLKSFLTTAVAVVVFSNSTQAVTVTLNADDPLIGFMNVFELPANGGGFVFGSGWGISDLTATTDSGANSITISPNTIGDPNEFWYQNTSGTAPDPANPGGPGQAGNKLMEANIFAQETGTFAGQTVTFDFEVLADSLTGAHQARAFIRDFAPDFSSSFDIFLPLNGLSGPQSISLSTINDPGRHIQYGYQLLGENVWVTDTAPFGSITLGAVPEPSTTLLGALGLTGLVGLRRRK